MNTDTRSAWADVAVSGPDERLTADVSCDVCVVGSGMAGLTTAYLLAREGKRVVVLDAKPATGTGETEQTTAQLAWYVDDGFTRLASVRGDDVARTAARDHRAAIDEVEGIARAESIDCDFLRIDAYLFPAPDGSPTLDEEAETMARLGLAFDRTSIAFPAGLMVEALRFPAHGRFHPKKYLAGLASAIRRMGGVIHQYTVVEKVRGGESCHVTTTHGHTVTAGAVIIAANNPFEGGTSLHSKVAAYATYVIAAEVPRGAIADAIYWDTEDPYHYLRFQPGAPGADGDLLILGGADHKTGQADDQAQRWAGLEAWARERFPAMGPVRYHWSGQVFETPDGLALIGPAPWNGSNVYLVTGDSGMGMTHGTIAGRLLTDLILGRPNDSAAVYSPSRLMPGALKTLFQENINVVAQFKDWFTGGDVKSADEIPPGHGAVVRSGLTKLAMYKDDKGVVTTLSAVCPHMGCIVRWNPGESTWDCPCHGSRFAATGTCLHGPSTSNLAKVEPAKGPK